MAELVLALIVTVVGFVVDLIGEFTTTPALKLAAGLLAAFAS